MAIIEVGNVHSKISGLSQKGLARVDQILAVPTPNHKFSTLYKTGRWDGMTRFFSMATKKFPTGLISRVVKGLNQIDIDVEIVDNGISYDLDIPEEIQLQDGKKTITLRDYQYDSVLSGLENTRGVVNVATNGGKTEIACGLIKCLLPTLKEGQTIAFFTHSKEIFSQSHKRLEARLGVPVGMIGNGKWEMCKVNIVMIPTVSKYLNPKKPPKNMSAEKFKEGCDNTKKLIKSIHVFIGDEVHHASSDTWYKLFMKLDNAVYRYGLTGTVDEADQINLFRLFGCTGPVIKKVSNQFLIDKGYSAKPSVFMLPIKTESLNGYPWEDAYVYGIVENEDRNLAFCEKILERVNSGKQALIIVNQTNHGEIVHDILQNGMEEVEFIHGDRTPKAREEALERFKTGEIKALIATTILDEGVDVPNINCLFLMAGGKSMRMLLQRIGRGLRKKADGSGIEVYDALDYHNKYLTEHTLERYNTYREEGFEVTKL